MLKSELIDQVASEYPDLTKKDVERLVNVMLETMISTLEKGGRIEFRGFGSFVVRHRLPGQKRNPRTGESIHVGNRTKIMFKAGRELDARVNGHSTVPDGSDREFIGEAFLQRDC